MLNLATIYKCGPPFKLFRFPDLAVELKNILIKRMGIGTTWKPKIIFNHLKRCFYHKQFWKMRSGISKCFIQFNISYVLLKSCACHLYIIHMLIVCTRMSLVCARIFSVCTSMSFICHSFVLACYLQVTRM